jgi:hypothetical protein
VKYLTAVRAKVGRISVVGCVRVIRRLEEWGGGRSEGCTVGDVVSASYAIEIVKANVLHLHTTRENLQSLVGGEEQVEHTRDIVVWDVLVEKPAAGLVKSDEEKV